MQVARRHRDVIIAIPRHYYFDSLAVLADSLLSQPITVGVNRVGIWHKSVEYQLDNASLNSQLAVIFVDIHLCAESFFVLDKHIVSLGRFAGRILIRFGKHVAVTVGFRLFLSPIVPSFLGMYLASYDRRQRAWN